MKHKLAILLLAAGGSKRMGKPKQMLKFNDTTILQHAIIKAVKSKVGDVFLLLGANAEVITDKHILSDVTVLINDKWKTGLAGSIVYGLKHIIGLERYEGVIIMLSDQVHLKAKNLKALRDAHKEKHASIIASRYKEGFGPPSLFTSDHFEALLKLSGDKGAKKYIIDNIDQVEFVDFEKGHLDIDTEEEFNKLIN